MAHPAPRAKARAAAALNVILPRLAIMLRMAEASCSDNGVVPSKPATLAHSSSDQLSEAETHGVRNAVWPSVHTGATLNFPERLYTKTDAPNVQAPFGANRARLDTATIIRSSPQGLLVW